MPQIHFDPHFETTYHKFTKRNPKRVRAIDRVLEIFASNPQHPSLQLEKLVSGEIWTIRVDRGNRLFFIWADGKDTAIFFLVGAHDLYRTLKK